MSQKKEFLKFAHGMKDRRQELMVDAGAFRQLKEKLLEDGVKRLYLISGKQTKKLKLYDAFVEEISEAGIRCFIYSNVGAQPEAGIIGYCAAECRTYNCEAILAFGGGTVIDIGKMVAAWLNNPGRSLYQMRGVGKIPNPGVNLYVVSTTSSGAESSACALIRHEQSFQMYFSENLIPNTVVLDSDLMMRLPAEYMASAVFLALTHAIEAYISTFADEFPPDKANILVAVPTFFSYMEKCFRRGVSSEMYLQMMMAPYYAGVATRRIGFGYAHCLAMRISEKYDIAPGRICAAVLPEILEFEFEEAKEAMAELARVAHLCSARATTEEAARALIEGVRSLARRVDLPATLTYLKPADFSSITEMLLLDGRTWGCPKRLTVKSANAILKNLSTSP